MPLLPPNDVCLGGHGRHESLPLYWLLGQLNLSVSIDGSADRVKLGLKLGNVVGSNDCDGAVESVGNIDTLGDTLLSVGDNVGGNVVVRQQVQFTFGDSPPLSTPNTIKLSTSPHTLSDTCPLNSLLSSRSSTVDKHLFDNIEQIQFS